MKHRLIPHILALFFVLGSFSSIYAQAPTTAKIAFTSDRNGNNEIYIMNPDGTEQVNLTRHRAADVQPAWSPTGQKILFVSNRDGRADLYLMDADGTNVRKVFKDHKLRTAPAWSPDGKRISYRRTDVVGELYIATLAQNHEERIAPAGKYDGYSSWSPDGTEIAFDAPSRGAVEISSIQIFNLKTRRKEALFAEAMLPNIRNPSWAASRNTIAFISFQGRGSVIYIAERTAEDPEPVVNPRPGFSTAHPEWAPDGNALVYEQYRQRDNDRHIYRVDLSEREPEKLTTKGINFFADWFDPAFALPVEPQPQLLTTTWGKIKK